jgi:uncharacterized membrane protein YtjA (UPF0391 family)
MASRKDSGLQWPVLEPSQSFRVTFSDRPDSHQTEVAMLGWALTFLIVALIAAALGFTGLAGAASSIAQILFVVFLILFLVAMISRAVQGRPPV